MAKEKLPASVISIPGDCVRDAEVVRALMAKKSIIMTANAIIRMSARRGLDSFMAEFKTGE
jgi:hypothetical protein